jgi:diguanylate cyclase (GGDEF)-like protein
VGVGSSAPIADEPGVASRLGSELSRLAARSRQIIAAEGAVGVPVGTLRWVRRMVPRTLGATALYWRLLQLRRRPDRAFALAFLDMDGLTSVDRKYGREATNRLLRAMVSCLRAGLGPEDRIFRYGGDEYVCVFGGPAPVRANAVLEDARRRFLAQCQMRFSFGIVTAQPTHTPYTLMKEAEAGMEAVRSLERGLERPTR